MKKRMLLFLSALMMMTCLLCGCGREEKDVERGIRREGKSDIFKDKTNAWMVDMRRKMLQRDNLSEGWASFYGAYSPKLHEGEYVQYESTDEYIRMSLVQTGSNPFLSAALTLQRNPMGGVNIYLLFTTEQDRFSVGQGVVDYRYKYYVTVVCDSMEEYFDVMSSFDSFESAAQVELMVDDDIIPGEQLVEENLNSIFGSASVERYTAEEILTRSYDDYYRFMNVLDYGLRTVNSSFEEAGITY